MGSVLGILHGYFTLSEVKPRFSGAFLKKCKLLLWGYERCPVLEMIFEAAPFMMDQRGHLP